MKQVVIKTLYTDRSDFSLKQYLKDISKYKILSLEEELELAEKIQQGDKEALNKLVTSNLRFVVSVAKQYQSKGVELLDLINDGNMGMIKAAEKFDPKKGIKFISYAVWWIRQAIMDTINIKAKMVRIPSTRMSNINKLYKAASELEQRLNRFPSNTELADYLNMCEDEVIDLMSCVTKTVSTDIPLSGDDDFCCISDLIIGDQNSDDSVLLESKKMELNQILNNLSDRDFDIIQMTFGLNGVQELPFDEIGKRFNMTGERIRQIKESCLKNLKENHSKELKQLYE